MAIHIFHTIPWTLSLAALLGSAAIDLRSRIIPNEFVVLIAICGLALCLTQWPGQTWISLLAAAGIFLALGVLSHSDLIGGGDVKLVAAVTLLVPPSHIGLLLIAIALAGGLLSSVYLAGGFLLRSIPLMQGGALQTTRRNGLQKWLAGEAARIASGKSVPYALAVLGGVIGYLARELPQCSSAISCSL